MPSGYGCCLRAKALWMIWTFNLSQDHNTDFIVKFPDWDPSSNPISNITKQNQMQMLLALDRKRRVLLQENSAHLPQAHLWYSTQEVVNALRLFLDGGNDLSGSLTYR